jgi:uncharacterized membrane protein
MSETKVFNLLIALAAGVVVYVIVVGGIVCIRDNSYDFGAYLTDIAQVVPYLFGAIIAVVLRGITSERKTGNGNHKPSGEAK